MSCDVGEVPMTYVKQQKGCRMSFDVGKAAEGLENELWLHLILPYVASPTSQLILQPFRCFTYVTWRAAHDYYI